MSKKRRPHKPQRSSAPAASAKPTPVAPLESVAAPAADALPETDAQAPAPEAADLPIAVAGTAAGEPAPAEAAAPASTDAATAQVPAVAAARPDPAPLAPATPSWASATQGDIRGVLIQVAGARLLLPNATIAEVLSYADPDPVGGDAPDWLLGRMRWRGWQLPLIAFGRLAGVAEEKAALGSKVVVLKALAGTGRTPYFAVLTQGFPRLVTVSRSGLVLEDDQGDAMPRGVQARVRLNENEALLPDLEAVEALISEALAQAA